MPSSSPQRHSWLKSSSQRSLHRNTNTTFTKFTCWVVAVSLASQRLSSHHGEGMLCVSFQQHHQTQCEAPAAYDVCSVDHCIRPITSWKTTGNYSCNNSKEENVMSLNNDSTAKSINWKQTWFLCSCSAVIIRLARNLSRRNLSDVQTRLPNLV